MLDNPLEILSIYLDEAIPFYSDLIRGGNPKAFTRVSKVTPHQLVLQMIGRKSQTQWAEVEALRCAMKDPVNMTDKGFFLARRKFNPEAVRVMSNEYIANIYDNYDDSIEKYKGLVILAADGSKVVLPATAQNIKRFGQQISKTGDTVQPSMCLLSTLHDTLNNLKLDVQVDRIDGSERDLAARHVKYYCDNYSQKALFTYDRGYPSIRLMDLIISKEQYFLMRTPSTAYKQYFDQIDSEEDRVLDVTYDRISTNDYREDRQFRQHLMNTTYHLRFSKIIIGKNEDGTDKVETLITNLPEEEFPHETLKDIYHMRWDIETSYNRLKNRMKMEEFSGYSPELILQDFYADAWMYNLVSLKIMQVNEQKPIDQKNGEYTVKRNFNRSVGTLKNHLLKAIMSESPEERNRELTLIDNNITSALTWVKKENRSFDRKTSVNKSKISYRNTY